ncbi:MAG: rhodanese-like domain-containing protein, partial [Moraxellaceae bacterium]|nr:rhodanese-like domain-containing protein [Pseudobdellovibrionaceae bacterium]
PDLIEFLNSENKDQEIVFVCRSGGRSGSATFESGRLGFKKTMNMTGGMLSWNALKLPIIKA